MPREHQARLPVAHVGQEDVLVLERVGEGLAIRSQTKGAESAQRYRESAGRAKVRNLDRLSPLIEQSRSIPRHTNQRARRRTVQDFVRGVDLVLEVAPFPLPMLLRCGLQ